MPNELNGYIVENDTLMRIPDIYKVDTCRATMGTTRIGQSQ